MQSSDMPTSELDEARVSARVEGRLFMLLWLVWAVWLPFLIPPIIGLIQAHPSLPRLVAAFVGTGLFAGCYLWATWHNVQHRLTMPQPAELPLVTCWAPIAALTALAVALAFLGHGNSWLSPFIFTSAYVGGRLSPLRAAPTVLALALLVLGVGWFADPNRGDLGQGVVFTAVVGIVTISLVRAVTAVLELHAAREEIARLAVMTERLRVARDLHDLLGHNLSLIALKSELARRLIGVAPERAASEMSDVEQVARTTLQEVREAVAAYRQSTLASELRGAEEILAAARIAYHYEEGSTRRAGALPATAEAALAWTVREGVTNVIKHSRARHCTIRVTRAEHTARVEVCDDGVAVAAVSGGGGNGLRGLAERVEALGGQLEAGPRAEGGFCLAVSVPLAARAPATVTGGAAAPSVPPPADATAGA